ncbi:RluA family pseudouridine synthase [Alicyclobacillus fastidiosus]|uniref:RNA pseudouridylate synthase n=1 Tax=Alicyclobacillus fastidiosus TaxID=392011 RepID=A0ABY6ZA00_9BACL|nr:RluA family pseudouridine synthase [Alicyclobacillus fastidiosus]WAH39654.1 RluA family pseudouridine synthase [Alicyclobacillus fastidiosus]GMA60861.1 putative RNA pseudouridine synthase YhcT [Alicyclobacillus fastidiosus]
MYEFTITDAEAGRKLSTLLSNTHGMSRRLLRKVIQTDGVLCNGTPVMLSYIVKAGDHIGVQFPDEDTTVVPEPMPLHVCYEDDNIVVVNKPAGVLTHPSARERTGSLLAGVAAYLQPYGLVPHSIHRLDKFTSGAIMFAKHAHGHHLFDAALRHDLVHRNYVAIAFTPTHPPLSQWVTFEDFIAQDPNKPSRRIVGDETSGQLAITHMCPIARVGDVSICVFRLETGRTHQIRLQMAARGMPLVGDRDYTYAYSGHPPTKASTFHERMLPHQALHAYQLVWRVRVTDAPTSAYAKPADLLEELWSMLGGGPSLHALVQSKAALS